MHTAYNVHQVLNLPLTIECMVAFEENILVGTKQGHLLMYSIHFPNSGGDATNSSSLATGEGSTLPSPSPTSSKSGLVVKLVRTKKFFSKKPILQLATVPEYSILLALTDCISVHDLDAAVTNFPCIFTVEQTKGASAFALDLVRQKSLTGESSVAVRLVVAVKRKLQFYYWKNRRFHELRNDLNLPDIPRLLAWCKDTLCVGFRGEYSLVKLEQEHNNGAQCAHQQEQLCQLFPTGSKTQKPSITLLQDERFALGKDEQTTFIDLNGTMSLSAVSWSSPPQELVHDPPYLLAVMLGGVEVRTDQPRLSIQIIELPQPKVICWACQGLVYVASASHIWAVQMVPVAVQIQQLLHDKQFELAVIMCSIISNESHEDKVRRVQQIRTLSAFDLFVNHKFKESMDVFFQLDIDASHVIGLFSELLPFEFRNQLYYPDKPPMLQGRDYENAMLALIEYLTQVRHRLNGHQSISIDPMPMVERCLTIKTKLQMLQILDTTLLKCYLKTNDALVAPLLRLRENNCHQEETKRALKRSHKYSELIIFYNTRNLHRKALILLHEHRDKADSPLKGHLQTVHYLQNLGPEHIDLICEFAAWVLDVSEQDGLTIFTEDLSEVETLPRGKVLEFLSRTKKSTVIPYLKHIILEWKEKNSLFHDALLLHYKDFILEQMAKANVSPVSPLSLEEVPTLTVSMARKELKEFLISSRHYSAELVLQQFPSDCLEEERAVLLGKLGRHREALIIFIYQLRDMDQARAYCDQQFKPGSDVYSVLFCLLVEPPDAQTLKRMSIPMNARSPVALDVALDVLHMYGDHVDLLSVLPSVPASVMLVAVDAFLGRGVERKMAERHHTQLMRGLMHAQHVQLQEERIYLESQKVTINESDRCLVCDKRFKNQGAFVRLPGGQVVHFACQDKAS